MLTLELTSAEAEGETHELSDKLVFFGYDATSLCGGDTENREKSVSGSS